MGEVSLLQYCHGVPDMPVPEVHPAMKEGGGAEATELGRGGGEGGHIQGVQHIWAPPGDDDLLQIPGEVGLSGGKRLGGGGQKPGEGVGGVAEDDEDTQ